MREFLEHMLPLLGVEHVWLTPDYLRLRAHAELEDLFREAESLDLVLSSAALQEHPTAVPCLPGSFALDLLLAKAQDLPIVYRSSVSLDDVPADLPTDLVVVGNARVRQCSVTTECRTALLAQVRVRLRTDELVERVFPVALDGAAQPRPEWARLVEQTRPADARPAVLPAGWRPALEAVAHRCAEAAAHDRRAAVEAARQGEIRRLDHYLRSLQDDLEAEGPDASVRRAAQFRAEGRRVLDALRSLLKQAEPWDSEWVLDCLRPRFRLGAAFPALFPGHGGAGAPRPIVEEVGRLPLDEATRYQVMDLLRGLPRQFTWADAEQSVHKTVEQRIARLRRGVAAGGSVSSLLDQEEARLREEHRVRVAEIEERLHLRVLASPEWVELVRYPVRVWRLAVLSAALPASALAAREIEVEWEGIDRTWRLPVCPGCGVRSTLRACEDGTLGCAACTSQCGGCGRVQQAALAHASCGRCGEPSCVSCGHTCSVCGAWGCALHVTVCPTCGNRACGKCGADCGACGRAVCRAHHATCHRCPAPICAEHTRGCAICERGSCPTHALNCATCLCPVCDNHSATCALCGQCVCTRCVGARGHCGTCLALAEIGENTINAMRSLLRGAAPDFPGESARRWWMARGPATTVVVARWWPRDHVFVLDAAERTLRSRRVTWSRRVPAGPPISPGRPGLPPGRREDRSP